MDVRGLIVERLSTARLSTVPWTLDVYYYLLNHGVAPDDVIKAMNDFVDEAIASRTTHNERAPVGD